ncbi:ATP-binding cassette domain-containing protein [Actinomyces gerencseriae]|uniref:ATP-binding cassette domain-containing protein n=1 Tax=Actinomyces gerencseriae TaxID=52769 RepID=UPI0028E9DA93|nr:ATP-binding cassette domain-containing protein [Actinomyces gerencseriae]
MGSERSDCQPYRRAGAPQEFRRARVVEDVTFDVVEGRVVGLLGRNGAGKTTTLRATLGLYRADSGEARVFGSTYDELPDAARRIGVSMDRMGALPGATVISDLRLWASTLRLPKRHCEEVLDFVGPPDMGGKRVSNLSTGMRQRHGLALAMPADPRLLILDEPASGLDPDGIRWLRETLRGLAAKGKTVLLSSHQLAEVAQTPDCRRRHDPSANASLRGLSRRFHLWSTARPRETLLRGRGCAR